MNATIDWADHNFAATSASVAEPLSATPTRESIGFSDDDAPLPID